MEVIKLHQVSKTYTYYKHGVDRLLEILTRHPRHDSFIALYPLDLTISHGQVVGVIGDNGAGKSTLLKLVANTLQPTSGHCEIKGRVAALLELGGGFHPDMTGKENVYLNGTMMGLSIADVDALYGDIVDFAGISDFMEHPVKTYSSGMFTRLAFAVATCIEPDILIVDEALSVGDGAFARKSFNRIMQFKQAGKTILFCSHSLYQIEAVCDRVLWLDKGKVRLDGAPSTIVTAYYDAMGQSTTVTKIQQEDSTNPQETVTKSVEGAAHLTNISVEVDGVTGKSLEALSLHSTLTIIIGFDSDPDLPSPTLGLVFFGADGRIVTSAGTKHDGLIIQRDKQGKATVKVEFRRLPLLKGEYWIDVYLLCENALHVYDQANTVITLKVRQIGLELGVVSLLRQWMQV